jgi:hypothetical protein
MVAATLLVSASSALAANASLGLITDLNFPAGDPNLFTEVNVFNDPGGIPAQAYTVDDTAVDAGNPVLKVTVNNRADGVAQAGVVYKISAGENGINQTFDGAFDEIANDDIPNTVGPDSVFAAIGNASGKLENGNVIRVSAWFKQPTVGFATMQIEPVLKIELWKEANSGNQDNDGGGDVTRPWFGDRVFDTDVNGQSAQWIDVDKNGTVAEANAAFEGRMTTLSQTEWTQVVHTYVVDDSVYSIGNPFDDPVGCTTGDPSCSTVDLYSAADIEEIRGVMFMGDWAGSDLTAGGELLVDNFLVEVFKDPASEQASNVMVVNPEPMAVVENADFNGDLDVDGSDFLTWQRGFLGTTTGDANGDGIVNGADLTIWQSQFGQTGGAANFAAVPEPAASLLALLATLGLKRKRRRDL